MASPSYSHGAFFGSPLGDPTRKNSSGKVWHEIFMATVPHIELTQHSEVCMLAR